MSFTVALSTVGVMLLYALPGFVMIKTKLLQSSAISAFAKLLMYICQPALIIYSFIKVDFSVKTLKEMIIVFVFVFIVQGDCDADGRRCDRCSHHAGDGPEIL